MTEAKGHCTLVRRVLLQFWQASLLCVNGKSSMISDLLKVQSIMDREPERDLE